jgi:hypothetical protein
MNEFKTLKDLYERLKPALRMKKRELKNITEEEIWNFLKDYKWKNSSNLTLSEMVNDILLLTNEEITNYRRGI